MTLTNPNGNPDTFRFIDGEGDPIDLPRPTPDTDALVARARMLLADDASECPENETCMVCTAYRALDALASQLKEAREAVLGAHSLGYETGKAEAEAKLARVTKAVDAEVESLQHGINDNVSVGNIVGATRLSVRQDALLEAVKEETL